MTGKTPVPIGLREASPTENGGTNDYDDDDDDDDDNNNNNNKDAESTVRFGLKHTEH
jgi:hypothetical protein